MGNLKVIKGGVPTGARQNAAKTKLCWVRPSRASYSNSSSKYGQTAV